MEFTKIKVRMTLLDELLGTASGDPEIYETYIASKAPTLEKTEEEVENYDPDEVLDKAMTGFPRTENGEPFLYDYQIRGFFKEAAGFCRKIPGSKSSKLKAYKKQIDGLVFVEPRQIPLKFKGFMGKCQRPLRAQTAQGERIALAVSETVPAGTTLEFEVLLCDEADRERVIEWLDYGKYHGLGQWRNAGKGRFEYEIIE